MDEHYKTTVRELRRNPTTSENISWQAIRNRKFLGLKFLRQHPIKIRYFGEFRVFIADFYCAEKRMIIEIDGSIHERQKDYDKLRDYIINQKGISVIRIANEDLLNLNNALEKIKSCL